MKQISKYSWFWMSISSSLSIHNLLNFSISESCKIKMGIFIYRLSWRRRKNKAVILFFGWTPCRKKLQPFFLIFFFLGHILYSQKRIAYTMKRKKKSQKCGIDLLIHSPYHKERKITKLKVVNTFPMFQRMKKETLRLFLSTKMKYFLV